MKRKFLTTLLTVLLATLMAFGIAACNDDSGKSSSKIKLDPTSLTLNEGGSMGTVRATYSGSTEGGKWEWTISDDTVAQITPASALCMVRPLKKGSATLTASFGGEQATCAITVGDPLVVETVSIFNGTEDVSGKTLELAEGGTLSLTATASEGSEINWSTDNEGVATVEDGLVTAVRPGTAVITAFVTASIRATVTVNVKAPDGTVYYDLQFGDAGNPVTEPPAEGGEGTPIPAGQFYYWASRTGWGQQVDIEHAYYRGSDYKDGTVYIKYTSDWDPGYYYGFQLYCYYPGLNIGTFYKFTCDITVDRDCTFNINDNHVDLTEGKNEVTVYYQVTSDKNFSLYTGYDTMDGTNGYFVKDVEFSIGNMKWTPDTRVQLKAPTFTVGENNVITIDDPNEEGVGSYLLGFYNEQGARVGTVAVKSGEAIDTSMIRSGTYTTKLTAQAANPHFIDSPESAEGVEVEVVNEGITYELKGTGASGALATPGLWTYYKSSWVEIREAQFANDTVTFEFANNAGNWDDTQLYYNAPEAQIGKYYDIELEITSNATGHIILSGSEVLIEEGTHTYLIDEHLQERGGATIAFVFALPGQANAQEIQAGRFEIKIKSITEGSTEPVPEVSTNPDDYDLGEPIYPSSAIEKNGEGDATNNTWAYWFVEDTQWGHGSVVTMNEHKYEDGTVTLAYTGGDLDRDFAVQLFYKNTTLKAGTQYFLFATVEVSSDLQIKLNGEISFLTAGSHELHVLFTPGTAFSMQCYGVGSGTMTVKVSDVYWKEVLTDEKPIDPNDYQLGAEIKPSTAAMEKNGEGAATNDTFAYWYAEDASWNCGTVVTMSESKYENGAVTFDYTGGSVDYSVQLFYKNTTLKAGTQYFLFATIEVSEDLQIKLNGQVSNLEAGSHDLFVLMTAGGTAFSLQCYGVGSGTMTVKISNVYWKEVLGGGAQGGDQPAPPASEDPNDYELGAAVNASFDKLLSGAEFTSQWDAQGTDNNPDSWVYWYVQDTSWNQGSVVTLTKPFANDNNAISFAYSGGSVNHCVQLFYKSSSLTAGKQYFITLKIHVSADCTAIINGKETQLTAGDNNVTVLFTLNAVEGGEGVSAIDIQFRGAESSLEVTVSDVSWREVLGRKGTV